MRRVNALQLRQSLGKILQLLKKGGAPIIIEKRRQAAAVLISIEDYERRFVDREADEARRGIVRDITEARLSLPGSNAVEVLRELRGGRR